MRPENTAKLAIMCTVIAAAVAATVPWQTAARAEGSSGATIYATKCASCHKADGKGTGPFPALAGAADVTAKNPSAMIGVLLHGKGLMPGYKSSLSDTDVAAVLTYIRSSWGNKAPAVSAAQVAAVH